MLISGARKAARVRFPIWTPLAVLLFGTLLIVWTRFDLRLASWFYDPALGWPGGGRLPWRLTNRYGEAPGFWAGVLGLLVLLIGLKWQPVKRWRRQAAFLFLLLLIGPGLLVNGIFKEYWARPRPLATQQFGGAYAYQPPLVPGWGTPEVPGAPARTSFPSGHAANGFYFIALYFIFRRKRRRLALAAFWFGIALGLFIGLGRVADGKHWASDVLWAFGMVYLTAWFLANALHLGEAPRAKAGTTAEFRLGVRG